VEIVRYLLVQAKPTHRIYYSCNSNRNIAEIKAINDQLSKYMQNLGDADKCDSSQYTLLMNDIEHFLKTAPHKNNEAGPSIATESTERTMSYESTEDSLSTYYQNDEIESETLVTREDLVEQHTDINELDNPSQDEIESTGTTTDVHMRCSQSELKDSAAPTHGRIKKLRWGIIEMRLHSVIPGDHPDTREGPPVSGPTE
jgi:hypothetical protein